MADEAERGPDGERHVEGEREPVDLLVDEVERDGAHSVNYLLPERWMTVNFGYIILSYFGINQE